MTLTSILPKSTQLYLTQLGSTQLNLAQNDQDNKFGWPLQGPSWPQNLPMIVSSYVPEGHDHLTAAGGAADQKLPSIAISEHVGPRRQNWVASRGPQLASKPSYGSVPLCA